VSTTWDGMQEFRQWLLRLPPSLVRQAAPLAIRAAAATEQGARAGYPTRSGRLVQGLSTSVQRAGEFGVSVIARSGVRYAGTYDMGSEEPRSTRRGRNRGTMPAGRVFVPAAERARDEMIQGITAMIAAQGFDIT
jgi:hypothetical protein